MQRQPRKQSIKTMQLIPILAVNLLIAAVFVVALAASKLSFRLKEAEAAQLHRALSARGEQVQQIFNHAAYLSTGAFVMPDASAPNFPSKGLYAFARQDGEIARPEWVLAYGTPATRRLDEGSELSRRPLSECGDRAYEISFGREKAVAVTCPLNYHTGGAAGGEGWLLVAGVESSALFSVSGSLTRFLPAVFVAVLTAGVVFSLIGAGFVARPVTRLTAQLLATDPDKGIRLDKTRIRKIDLLIDAIEALSRELAEKGRRADLAIEMTGMPIGFLEVNEERGCVYLSGFLLSLFAPDQETGSNQIPLSRWEELHARLKETRDPKMEDVYQLDTPEAPLRWLNIRLAEGDGRTFGIVIDVTEDILEKRRLEFERDTDPLTGLLGRHAFFAQAEALVRENPGRIGVMLFADLDNLKYINDTYGHEFGDRYIRAAAGVFRLFMEVDGIVSRISGDEFAIFLYGYDSKEQLAGVVAATYANMKDASIYLPGRAEMSISCSIGFAWYPDDSSSLDQLLKYADFAMYETKRSTKGNIREFSVESYLQNSSRIERNEEFNQFIERNQVYYVFQPIVEIYSGTVFGYEALMRPETPEFKTPRQILQIARDQAKLYQVERMTVFNTYTWMDGHQEELGGRRIFYNSIANQLLSDKDNAEVEARFSHLFPGSVVEITEDEHGNRDFITEKIDMLRKRGIGIAIGGYGAGDTNEAGIINARPGYIKIDRLLVRDAQQSRDKRRVVEDIIRHARPLGIKIIAEGIESDREMESMIRLGADYLQGYFLARPDTGLQDLPEDIAKRIRELASRHRDRRDRRDRRQSNQEG